LESLESRYLLSHPTVTAVNVASTNWSPNFVASLESSGLGTSNGYAIPVGSSAQLNTLPWTNINQVSISFSEDVKIEAGDLSVSGVNTTAYAFSGFTYNSTTHTATWTLSSPITKDKLMLDLDANGMAPVCSAATGESLDGAWTNCQSTFNSGNGQGGADFDFCFNVLPGDVNSNNATNILDANAVNQKIGKNAGDAGYSVFLDVDGSSSITLTDRLAVQSLAGSVLPTGNPVGMADEAPTTGGIPDVSVDANTADYVLSLPNFFEYDETPSNALTYSVVKDTNSPIFASLPIDSSGNLTLNFAANTTGSAALTVRATDASGLIVDTAFNVNVSHAPTTTGIPNVNVAVNTANYVVSLPNFFQDDQTPSNALVYSVINDTNPSLFTSLPIDSSGNLTLNFVANTTGNAALTVRATDANGLSVDTAFNVNVSTAPVVGDFTCTNEIGNYWTMAGAVVDNSNVVAGDVVTFGGVLGSYGLTAIVGADGMFSITADLPGLLEGTATAQTTGPTGIVSNVAWDWVIVC
jgi:hypothetical protein